MYINGVLVSNSTLNNNEFWQDPSHSKTTLGGIYQGGTGPVIQGLIGKIDDVGFWNRALTEQEIQNLYNSSTGDILLNGTVSENNQMKMLLTQLILKMQSHLGYYWKRYQIFKTK